MRSRIVIASILKPVDDTRMFEKFAISLSNTNKYDVNIIGFCSKKNQETENIQKYPQFEFGRLSIRRIFASLLYFKIILKVKPEVIIVTTPELLPVTALYKHLFKCKIIYDIQENYKNNILYNNVYPKFIRRILASLVRKIEIIFAGSVFHFLLAETCYENELNFIRNNYSVIENKYKEPGRLPKLEKIEGTLHFLYSGTIARNYGIFEAIAFIKDLYKHQENIHLTIAGYCSQEKLLQEMLNEISDCPYITLVGGAELVPHPHIIGLIKIADFGLVTYQPDNSIAYKIPTKLYEYLANELPIFLQDHTVWVDFCKPYENVFPVNFNSYNFIDVLKILSSKNISTSVNLSDLYWKSEEKKFLDVIEAAINHSQEY